MVGNIPKMWSLIELSFCPRLFILLIHWPLGFYHTHKNTWRKFLAYLEGILYSWILMWLMPFAQVWTWLYKCSKGGLVIPKKKLTFFCNFIEFSMSKTTQIQYLSHLRFKNLQITFIKSYSWSIFQKYQEHT
jgi:hypothetical protein